MASNITIDVLDDYLCCKYKAHLRMTGKHGISSDYERETDHLSFDEIFISVFQGEIIEDYPEDMPYPSCLIYGTTFKKEPIHSVWAYNRESRWP